MHLKSLLRTGLALAALTHVAPALAAEVLDVATAKAIVAKAAAPSLPWDGPTTGPKAQPNKTVILVSEDQRNGGALGVSEGVTEAAHPRRRRVDRQPLRRVQSGDRAEAGRHHRRQR